MENTAKNQLVKDSSTRLTTTSNVPSQRAVDSLLSQLFVLHNKYIGTPVATCGASITSAS